MKVATFLAGIGSLACSSGAAIAQVGVPPQPLYNSGSFVCEMNAESGDNFSLEGKFGNRRVTDEGASAVDFLINAPGQESLSGVFNGRLERGTETYFGFDDEAGTTTLATLHALSAKEKGALMIQLRRKVGTLVRYEYFVGHCSFELSYSDSEFSQ